MALPPAPNHNVRECNDLSLLVDFMNNIGDGEGVLVKDGKVAIAPFVKRTKLRNARFSEKLRYAGQYRITVSQPEGRPANYIINGGHFVLTFELSQTNNNGHWFLTADPHEEGVPERAYVAGGLGPDGLWAEHTQVRLYVNERKDEG